ncbi:MAG TPA: DAK2 domain-containing protein [Clostridia bacterium]|nr:DAK2 domain-containing protein [Clostridia bacterium]
METISGQLLKDMLISASNAIGTQKQEVNELNVFPVPDGDTGTNMSMTMGSAMRELSKLSAQTVTEVADLAATSLLRGARGNSGVILSLLFRGIAKGLKDKAEASGTDLAAALQAGVDSAYKAVMKPAEGTILTVARESAQEAARASSQGGGALAVFQAAVNSAKQALANTPELLPVLKKAGVVDAGGKGLVIIFDAMLYTLSGNGILQAEEPAQTAAEISGAAGEVDDEEINFTYCTEFIINKSTAFAKDPLSLRAYLESIGDCVLVADDSNFIKVHVHTDNPGKVIQEALGFGYLTDMKIDNMRVQHERKAAAKSEPVPPEKPYGFVVVAAGKGVADLFKDLGADTIVEGGQTMNPSTEDILAAIESTPAENVIVLPNNKNIILAAEQTVSLADRKVHVLHTKTIPQGISALLSFDADTALNDNLLEMEAACDHVKTGLITFAARDSDFEGHKIKKDEILALANGKLSFTDNDPVKAAVRLTKSLSDKDTSYVTLIYGEGISPEQAEAARKAAAEKLGPQVEVNLINGGQPVYHFILSVE